MIEIVKARVDSDLKSLAEQNLEKMGVSMAAAIRSLVYVIAEEGRIPFEFKVPNVTTAKVIQSLDAGEGKRFKTKTALKKYLNE